MGSCFRLKLGRFLVPLDGIVVKLESQGHSDVALLALKWCCELMPCCFCCMDTLMELLSIAEYRRPACPALKMDAQM
ncbi:hypothetical protein Nepgr_017398 [Nepenthes gracilis]|uniref:Uncharacterized protein n=1 Tax=Nepenthes gracilis TaxID=150966 RepID=A0AAD3SSB2_NEPGR|nr:hypothetical protein Nepgr_017398 [Nepenthes gracilis]